jgi:hypothetical protein
VIGADGRSTLSALAPPTAAGQIGNFIFLQGPPVIAADLSLLKRIRIREKFGLEIYTEFLNAFNHPVFLAAGEQGYAAPPVNIESTTFGQTTSLAVNPRNIQFRAKLTF